MTTATDSETRQAFITGLRDLADYLTAHPGVPVPRYGTDIIVTASRADHDGITEVDNAARHLGVAATDTLADDGSYEACRAFGPLGYRVTALSSDSMARFRAERSYTGCVTP